MLSSHHVGLNKKFSRKLFNEQEKLKNPELYKQQHKKLIKSTKKNLQISDTKTLDTFFKQKQVLSNTTNDLTTNLSRKRVLINNVEPIPSENNEPGSEVQVLKDSVILFDDIDVVLKEDQGFWSVICFFIKNSKKPIILTCNDVHMLKKIDLNIEQIKFYKPSRELCINYLKTILLCESKRCLNEEFHLNQLITHNKCDLRHSLLQLQINTSISKYDSLINEPDSPVNCKIDASLTNFIDYYLIIDYLNSKFNKLTATKCTIMNHDPLKYDCFIYKEGLIDDLSSTHATLISESQLDDEKSNSLVNFSRKSFLKQIINYMSTNKINKKYKIFDCYSDLSLYEPQCNLVLYKFALTHFKFTSNKSLYLDYASYLKYICRIEQFKHESNLKRRYLVFILVC